MNVPTNFRRLMSYQPYARDASKIGDARDHYKQVLRGQGIAPTRANFLAFLAMGFEQAFDSIDLNRALTPRGEPIHAFVVGNRWMAECPACCQCEPVDPESCSFWCPVCKCVANDGYAHLVDFPEYARVVRLLMARPDVTMRHSAHALPAGSAYAYESESADVLAFENKSIGLVAV